MKKNFTKLLIIVLIVELISFSCKKKQITTEKTEQITTDGNVLSFNTVSDFEKSITISNNNDVDNKIEEFDKMNFTNYFESIARNKSIDTLDEVKNEFINHLLNKDLIVEIEGFLIRINKPNENVFVLPSSYRSEYQDLVDENLNNKHILLFSTNDNVLELLFETKKEKALSKKCQSTDYNKEDKEYANFKDVNKYYGNDANDKYRFERKLLIKYDNWGIYRNLYTRFEHNQIWGSKWDKTRFSISYSFKYENSKGEEGNVIHIANSFINSMNYTGENGYEYDSEDKEILHYRGVRCLSRFAIQASVWMRNRETLKPTYIAPIQLSRGY